MSSPSLVPNPSLKSRSQIQVPNSKSKVQRKGNGTGADIIILQAIHPTSTTNNFSHLKCQYSDGKRPYMTFYDLLSPSVRPSLIECLLSRPGLIAGPLHSTPLQIISQSIPRLDPIDSKSSMHFFQLWNYVSPY